MDRWFKRLEWYWAQAHWSQWLLWPLSALFRVGIYLRKWAYRIGWLKQRSASLPVIVVGNLRIGGSGKTPVVIALTQYLQEAGLRVGIVSRGYGRIRQSPCLVEHCALVEECGDEPYLIAQKTKAPVGVALRRIEAIQLLQTHYTLDIILSDDGLQHYALARDLEICLIEKRDPLKNQWLLPTGPFREPWSRLKTVDFIWELEETVQFKATGVLEQLCLPSLEQPISEWLGRSVHAVCGIARPQRFFDHLEALGLKVIPHAFADHHAFRPRDFEFKEDYPVVMTEKDAVKCREFAKVNWWSLPIEAKIAAQALENLKDRIFLLKGDRGYG